MSCIFRYINNDIVNCIYIYISCMHVSDGVRAYVNKYDDVPGITRHTHKTYLYR